MSSRTRPAVLAGLLTCVCGLASVQADDLLRPDDSIALVGGTFVEQMQQYGFLESLLQARRPELALRVRNVGWSGDNVHGVARALFDEPGKGYERLQRDLAAADPSLAIVAYGTSEALDGIEAAERFGDGLRRLTSDLREAEIRVVLVAPYRMPGVQREDYEAALAAVREQIMAAGVEQGLPVIDLGGALEEDDFQLLHPSAAGHYRIARRLADGLLANPTAIPFARFTADEPAEALRQAIVEKNELFFHRYRPQNETYLYLFRKHEQGNNAAEIGEFEPLIEAADAKIHHLASKLAESYARGAE